MQEKKWKKEMPEIPENVHKAVLSALDVIEADNKNVKKGNFDMKNCEGTSKKYKVKKIIRPMIAVAACVAILVTATTVNHQFVGNNQNNNQVSEKDSALQYIAETFPDFSITAYAAELDVAEANEGNIIFVDTGIGENGYTGMLFSIQGENISDVAVSLDKGELYSATIENTTEDVLTNWLAQGMPDEDNNPDTHTIMKMISQDLEDDNTEPQTVQLYRCTKKGTEISESYSSEMYYGFYIPDNIVSSMAVGEDLASAYHKMLEVFEGSELKVTVTYKDGTTLEKKYTLSTAKLMQDENGMITQDEWTGSGEGAFVYGILAKER